MMQGAVTGALAGLAGTAVMTLLMKPGLAGRLPARWRPDEWVPRQVVQWAETVAGEPDALDGSGEVVAATLVHFGYGASMGALYGFLRDDVVEAAVPPAAAGAAWGLLVWAAGYEGWMPAVGVRPRNTDEPPTRWPVPIGNHVVFGVVTALAHEALRDRDARRRAIRIRV